LARWQVRDGNHDFPIKLRFSLGSHLLNRFNVPVNIGQQHKTNKL